MTKAMTKRETVPANSRLAKSERELIEASQHMFEDFVATGVILMRILDKKEFADGGFTSFNKYMNERQPLGLKASQAKDVIRAARIRSKLPDLKAGAPALEKPKPTWTVRAIVPLTNKDLEEKDVKRIAGEVAKRVAEGETLSEKMVKDEINGDLVILRKRDKSKKERTTKEVRLSFHVKTFLTTCKRYRKLFESVTAVRDWEDVERDSSGLAASVADELEAIASYLRS